MPEPSDPLELRKEILDLLGKVTNRGSLLFFQWLIQNIDKELPSIPELKKLHQTFIRVIDAFQHKNPVSNDDWRMMFKYVGEIGNNLDISRHLASTVKLYREKAGLTRLQVAKRARINMKKSQPANGGRLATSATCLSSGLLTNYEPQALRRSCCAGRLPSRGTRMEITKEKLDLKRTLSLPPELWKEN